MLTTGFERRRQKIAPRAHFVNRMARAVGIWFVITGVGLAIGVAGYMGFGGLGIVDAFENAAMILSGMGPVADLSNNSAKIFAGCYAIFSDLLRQASSSRRSCIACCMSFMSKAKATISARAPGAGVSPHRARR